MAAVANHVEAAVPFCGQAHLERNLGGEQARYPAVRRSAPAGALACPDHENGHEGAAKDPFGNQRLGFEGSTAISRKDFGITWNATLESGGVLVSDKVVLEFEVSAIKTA